MQKFLMDETLVQLSGPGVRGMFCIIRNQKGLMSGVRFPPVSQFEFLSKYIKEFRGKLRHYRTPQRENVAMAPEPVVFNAKIRNRILVRILVAASLVLAGMGLVLYLLT